MRDNWVPEDDEWGDWDKAMKLGLDYLVGSRVLIGKLLRSHRTLLDDAPYDNRHTSQASS